MPYASDDGTVFDRSVRRSRLIMKFLVVMVLLIGPVAVAVASRRWLIASAALIPVARDLRRL